MLVRSRARAAALVTAAVLGVATGRLDAQSTARAGGGITTPKAQFGFDIGADYQLATYRQLADYWRKLDAESDRLSLVEIGKTAEGRPQLMAIVTAPENQKRLGRYQEITRRLALAEGLTDVQAKALAAEGRAVVWIDGGLHANEVLGAQQLIETSYRLVSGEDDETRRILRDVVILMVHANPDGHDLVADWYLRNPDPLRRSMAGLPRLYQKYIGHDNNRDSYMSTQPESTNMNRVLYREWFPQILYNHHQTGPSGTVLFAPPFRDPFNYVFDPLVPVGIDLVGAAMHQRFIAEGKPGATMRRGANYSTWWNGGLRTTAYYHNMIGLLTEAIGSPDADGDPVRAVAGHRQRRPAVPDRAADVALPPVDRVRGHRQHGGARRGVAASRVVPLQRLPDGQALDRARQHRHLDGDAAADRSRAPARRRESRPACRRRRRWAAASATCRRPMPACCASRPIATRAATSCPPRSGTSPPPSSSPTR